MTLITSPIFEEYRSLVVALMLELWRPQIPHVILELCGEQGSAKSTTHIHCLPSTAAPDSDHF